MRLNIRVAKAPIFVQMITLVRLCSTSDSQVIGHFASAYRLHFLGLPMRPGDTANSYPMISPALPVDTNFVGKIRSPKVKDDKAGQFHVRTHEAEHAVRLTAQRNHATPRLPNVMPAHSYLSLIEHACLIWG